MGGVHVAVVGPHPGVLRETCVNRIKGGISRANLVAEELIGSAARGRLRCGGGLNELSPARGGRHPQDERDRRPHIHGLPR